MKAQPRVGHFQISILAFQNSASVYSHNSIASYVVCGVTI